MLTLEVEFDTKDVLDTLVRLDSCFSPIGRQMFMQQRVVPWLQERAQARFDTEGDAASGKWAPLAGSTVEIRQNEGFPGSHPINIRTGDMETYITQGSGTVTHSGWSTLLEFPRADIGGVEKVKINRAQRGDSRTPRRPVLAIDQSDMMHIMNQFKLHIESFAGGRGGN